MERYTEEDAVKCGRRLAELLEKKFGNCLVKEDEKHVWVIDCWDVDYNPVYGGAVIEEIANEAGGIHQPFGAMRRSPRDFCETVRLAEEAIRILKEK